YTPSKWMRLMTAAMARTSSGSFLVSKDPVTSASRIACPVLENPPAIPGPDWSLLRTPTSQMSRAELEQYTEDLQDSLHNAKHHIQSRDMIIEAAHAQMIVQELFAKKQSQTLHAHENQKKTDRAKLFPEGKGCHLTEEGFMKELERLEEVKRQEKGDKAKRKAERVEKRTGKARIDVEWKALLAKHDENITRWSATCEELAAKLVPKKDWPKKPRRPLK
ncbi:hypothetical protein BU15DRAFT_31168, partial [Melanogaster broomeanus]